MMFCDVEGKRKVHYLFDDGKEMAEEYDMKTDELIRKSSQYMIWCAFLVSCSLHLDNYVKTLS